MAAHLWLHGVAIVRCQQELRMVKRQGMVLTIGKHAANARKKKAE